MSTNWKNMEGEIAQWLKSFIREGLEYRGPNQAIPGFPSHGFRSDGLLTDGSVLLAVEIEAGQMHPDTNVGKYWYLQTLNPYRKICLFHVYTPDFNSYEWRKSLGEFYIQQMGSAVPIEYVQIDLRHAVDYAAAVQLVKTEVGKRIRAEFP